MGQSFEEQFPEYKLIPEKKNKWAWPLTWAVVAVFLVGVPIAIVQTLSFNVPVPEIVGINKFTLPTVRQLAISQYQEQKYAEASQSFARYFVLGGQEADMMALYAAALSQIGEKSQARTWIDKAVKAQPTSKTAVMVRDLLEKDR